MTRSAAWMSAGLAWESAEPARSGRLGSVIEVDSGHAPTGGPAARKGALNHHDGGGPRPGRESASADLPEHAERRIQHEHASPGHRNHVSGERGVLGHELPQAGRHRSEVERREIPTPHEVVGADAVTLSGSRPRPPSARPFRTARHRSRSCRARARVASAGSRGRTPRRWGPAGLPPEPRPCRRARGSVRTPGPPGCRPATCSAEKWLAARSCGVGAGRGSASARVDDRRASRDTGRRSGRRSPALPSGARAGLRIHSRVAWCRVPSPVAAADVRRSRRRDH